MDEVTTYCLAHTVRHSCPTPGCGAAYEYGFAGRVRDRAIVLWPDLHPCPACGRTPALSDELDPITVERSRPGPRAVATWRVRQRTGRRRKPRRR